MSKVTIITGGTSGIGRGIAEKILENSASDDILYVSYGHNTEQAEEFLHAQTEENQKKIRLLQADMSSYDEMMKFVSRVKEEASHIDWLINNVGISTYAKYEDYTFDEWTKIVNTNLSVPVFLVKELRPIMSEGGSILFTGSYAGQQAYSSSLVYGVTKSAIHFLTKSLVKELEPKQIRSMPLPRDLLKPAGIRTALRKAMNALTVRLRFTASVRSQKWQIWHTKF